MKKRDFINLEGSFRNDFHFKIMVSGISGKCRKQLYHADTISLFFKFLESILESETILKDWIFKLKRIFQKEINRNFKIEDSELQLHLTAGIWRVAYAFRQV